jgi:hypothetical protein
MRPKIAAVAATIRRSRGKASLILAAAGGLLLSAGASPALADGYTLHLSAPATVVVGQPIIIEATGVNPPPDQYWAGSWIEVVAIPTTVTTTCPASAEDGTGVATGTGGSVLAISLRPNLDAAGNFTNQIGATATTPGSVLICGYQDDGAGLTLARDSLTIEVRVASSAAPAPTPAPTGSPATTPSPTAGAKPGNLTRPRVTRSARRLRCTRGSWSNHPTRYAFRWLVAGRQMPGQTSGNLRLTHRVRGHKVRCTVTASNAAGATSTTSPTVKVR